MAERHMTKYKLSENKCVFHHGYLNRMIWIVDLFYLDFILAKYNNKVNLYYVKNIISNAKG